MVDSRTCTRHGDEDPAVCSTIADLLARIGDKWSLLIVTTLGEGPLRFNELRRRVTDISQKMLSSTLKVLERDGLVSRSVAPSVPPQVEYALTDLGRELLVPVSALAAWTADNTARILTARAKYDLRAESLATG
jgi:DNA-binding HxlR family transcriptional regulator